ncbi:unnamed protein product, partial [Acidithrix sp. C25]
VQRLAYFFDFSLAHLSQNSRRIAPIGPFRGDSGRFSTEVIYISPRRWLLGLFGLRM